MCRWMGSHFLDWIDYDGIAFSIDVLEWSFGVRKFFIFSVSKRTRIYRRKVKCSSFSLKNGSIHLRMTYLKD